MNWFVWRQHRKQFLVFGILLAIFAALVIPTGINYWNTYQRALTTCAHNPLTPNCNALSETLFTSSTDSFIRIAVVLSTFGLPILVGLFLGSPLLAREYEEGTNKLAWTQSVSRRKWLTVKLLWALGFALLYGIAVTLLATWWSRTYNALADYRFIQGHFESQGLMPVAYTIFFTALGFMTGAWFRKALISIAVTFGVFVFCMAGFGQLVRQHYAPPITVTAPMGPGEMEHKIPAGAWVLKNHIEDKSGKAYDSFNPQNMPESCRALTQNIRVSDNSQAARVKASGGDPVGDCLTRAGYHQVATFQPSYRYWNFQRIEAGIYLGMTALAVGATYWIVLKRDA